MPKPSPFTRKDGSIGWRVCFRLDSWSNPSCETFDTVKSAQWFCDLVDKVGGRAAREARDAALHGEKVRVTAEAFEELIERKNGYCSA